MTIIKFNYYNTQKWIFEFKEKITQVGDGNRLTIDGYFGDAGIKEYYNKHMPQNLIAEEQYYLTNEILSIGYNAQIKSEGVFFADIIDGGELKYGPTAGKNAMLAKKYILIFSYINPENTNEYLSCSIDIPTGASDGDIHDHTGTKKEPIAASVISKKFISSGISSRVKKQDNDKRKELKSTKTDKLFSSESQNIFIGLEKLIITELENDVKQQSKFQEMLKQVYKKNFE